MAPPIDGRRRNRVQDGMAIPSKFVEPRPYSNPETAARKLLDIAAGIIDVRGRVSVGAWNDAFRKAGGYWPN
ncbi:MAG: hypothetical protein JWR35_3778 [Marmoricola sp.]|nr:hypothetical protein [Marmoricola sp.]